MAEDPLFLVGDIISAKSYGPIPMMPKELEGRYFRVESVDEGCVKLSRPYVDAACTIPFHPKRPRLGSVDY